MTAVWIWLREHPRAALGGAAGVVLLAAGAFAAGRWMAPIKVETRTETRTVTEIQTVEVAREVKVEGPVRVVERWRPGPEAPPPPGCPECPPIREREETRGPTTTTTDTGTVGVLSQESVRVVEKLVERAGPRFTLAATIGSGFSSGGMQPPAYGLLVSATVAGPLTVAVQGEGNATGGSARIGLGLTF